MGTVVMGLDDLLRIENLLVPIVLANTWLVWRISRNESKIQEGQTRDNAIEKAFSERMLSLEERFAEHERNCAEVQNRLYDKLDELAKAFYLVSGKLSNAQCLTENRKPKE